LPMGEFPQLRSLAPVLAAYDGGAELERGLDFLLAGLATMAPSDDPASEGMGADEAPGSG